jgi:hypothetical protein
MFEAGVKQCRKHAVERWAHWSVTTKIFPAWWGEWLQMDDDVEARDLIEWTSVGHRNIGIVRCVI